MAHLSPRIKPSLKPTRKVSAGAFAGAVTTVAVWALAEYGGTELPPEIASSVTVIVTGIVSWFVKDE